MFFFRVRAVYCNNRIITVFFGCLWLTLLGLSCIMPLTVKVTHLGTTQRCIVTSVAPHASAPIVLNAILDTLIFIAISIRLVSFSFVNDGTFGARMKSFWRGDGLPTLSRSLLQGGQLYFLFVDHLLSSFLKCTNYFFPHQRYD
jgi:hypothetical protein